MYERETTQKCLQRLRALGPVESVDIRRGEGVSNDLHFDGLMEIRTAVCTWNLIYETKRNFNKVHLPQILALKESLKKRRGFPRDVILFTTYVNRPTARLLKENQVNFVDFAGNAFLNLPECLYLYIEGQKPESEPAKRTGRIYQHTGLRLLFSLLTQEETASLPYRQLADLSGIALGSVGWIMRELREKNYLEKTAKGKYKLVNREELMLEWAKAYKEKLRPKLVMGNFKAQERNWDKVIEDISQLAGRSNIRWAVTGGFAADLLVHYYRGENLVIFFEDLIDNFLTDLRWLPSTKGNISVLNFFSPRVVYSDNYNFRWPVAHPLLVYSELLWGGSDRQIETARIIYERYLRKDLGQASS